MSQPLDFGVQSYCFRHFKDNKDVAAKVREIGVDKIEVCGVHADFSKPAEWADIVKIYQDAGVQVISLGVQTFTGNDAEKAWFECAALAGAKHISAHFRIDTHAAAIIKVRKWCREFGIRVGIHPHGGYMFGGQPDVIEYLLGLGAPEIGICMDTAWVMQIGPQRGNPVQWVKDFGSSVYGLHYKDFTFGSNGAWEDTIVGQGNLDLPALVSALQEAKFDGMAVLEYEADVENPVPALRRCVEAMRQIG